MNVCERVKELDFLINAGSERLLSDKITPVPFKNMKGLDLTRKRDGFASLGLHKPIAHLNMGIQQDSYCCG